MAEAVAAEAEVVVTVVAAEVAVVEVAEEAAINSKAIAITASNMDTWKRIAQMRGTICQPVGTETDLFTKQSPR